jgi:hypothetical protein
MKVETQKNQDLKRNINKNELKLEYFEIKLD